MKRKAVLFVLLAAAVIFAVWRVGTPSSGKAAAGQPSGSLSFEEGSSTGAIDFGKAVTEMSVFTNPRTESDVLPDDFSFRLGRDDIAGQSRLLLAGLGQTNASLYAWPMTSGGVCWAWGEGEGGCLRDFSIGDGADLVGIDPDAPGAGAPGTIVGLVSDDVLAAQVKVDGIDHDALVENNGLFYELSDAAAMSCQAVNSVTISYQDGGSNTFPHGMGGWISDPPETDAQSAGHDVDGLDGDPIAPPPDEDPPQC